MPELALDLLPVAAAAGEVTELPPGAIYGSLDDWVYESPTTGFRALDATA
ncbi:hypothetical protein ACQP0C_22740 [Nocardia sp. CA-129566]